MGLIKVNQDKCTRDGICVEVCPLSLLALDAKRGPKLKPKAAQHCIGCGHCVAACPHGALDNRKNPLAKQVPIPADFSMDRGTAAIFLRSRRSIRLYKDDPIPRDRMVELLDIARFSPSGHNSQGVSYLVVEGRENLDRVREIVIDWMREFIRLQPEAGDRYHMPAIIRSHEKGEDRVLRGAPQLIVAHASRHMAAAQVSTHLALEYVEIYAPLLGIGTCWAGYTQLCAQQFPAMPEFLKIPADRIITGMLMAGLPKYGFYRLPARNDLDVAWFDAEAAKSGH